MESEDDRQDGHPDSDDERVEITRCPGCGYFDRLEVVLWIPRHTQARVSRMLRRLCTRAMACLTAGALIALLAVSVQAADRHVSTTGDDRRQATFNQNQCLDLQDPCKTIQWALGWAFTGDVVKVQTGTFLENIDVKRDLVNVTIEGGWGADGSYTPDPSATIIDGGNSSSTISLALTDQALDLSIRNFRVIGGNAERGGGIYVRSPDSGEAALTVYNVEFDGNRARYDGGAIYLVSAVDHDHFTLTLGGNTFTNNTCWGTTGTDPYGHGGALSVINYSHNLSLYLYDNIFDSNHSSADGGAFRIYSEDGGSAANRDTVYVRLWRNVLDGNTTDWVGGGAVFRAAGVAYINAQLENNLVVNNDTGIFAWTEDAGIVHLELKNDTVVGNGDLGGVATDTAVYGSGSIDVDVYNAILWGNSGRDLYIDYDCTGSAEYSDIGTAETHPNGGTYTDGAGNISEDPQFLDAAGGDYHLLWDSPAVDTANCAAVDNHQDFDRDARPDAVTGLCDMGFDEVATAVLSNGDAPPNPDNVIDDDRYAGNSGLDVRDWPYGAPRPTFVEVVSGADLGRWIRSFDSSVVTLRGGATQGAALYAFDDSLIEVAGTGFERNGFPERMGDLRPTSGSLTGILESGEPFDLAFHQGGSGGLYHGTVRLAPPADAHLINNGLAPPTPENVIADWSHKDDFVYVRNLGCAGVVGSCLNPFNTTQVELTGATAELQVFDTSRLTLGYGGNVYGRLTASDRAFVSLLRGTIRDDLVAFDEASIVLGESGLGSFVSGDVFALGASDVSITWGSFGGGLWAGGSSTMTVKGGAGSSNHALHACDSSVVEIHGYGFLLPGIRNLDYGDLAETSGQLYGELVASGPARFDFHRGGSAVCGEGTIRLVEGETSYLNTGSSIPVDHLGYEFHRVYVRNQGCIGDESTPCASSLPTHLQLDPGSGVGSRLYVYDDSSVALASSFAAGEVRGYDAAQISLSGQSSVRDWMRLADSSSLTMSGGQIHGAYASGSSTLSLGGGRVSNSLYLYESSTLLLNGATVDSSVTAWGSAAVTMSAGQARYVDFGSSSSLLLNGGSVGEYLWARSGTVSVTAGSLGNLEASGTALVVLGGGDIWQNLVAKDSSQVSVTGGAVHAAIETHNSATLVMEAGEAGSLFAHDDSTVEINGAAIANQLSADGSASVELRGGSVGGLGILAGGASTIQVFGSDFEVDGASVPPGALAATSGLLSGTLESKEPFSASFEQGQSSSPYTGTIELVAVPEPELALLQGLALLSVAVLRRRRAR
jgi:hypothetical protein